MKCNTLLYSRIALYIIIYYITTQKIIIKIFIPALALGPNKIIKSLVHEAGPVYIYRVILYNSDLQSPATRRGTGTGEG